MRLKKRERRCLVWIKALQMHGVNLTKRSQKQLSRKIRSNNRIDPTLHRVGDIPETYRTMWRISIGQKRVLVIFDRHIGAIVDILPKEMTLDEYIQNRLQPRIISYCGA